MQDHREPLSIEALAGAKHAADTLITSGVCTVHEVRQLHEIIDRIDATVKEIHEQQGEQD